MATRLADSTFDLSFKVGNAASVGASFRRADVSWNGIKEDFARQSDRFVLWVPLFLLVGNWTYFNLAQEPSFWAAVVLLLASAFIFYVNRAGRAGLAIALVLAGFGLAKMRQAEVATPLLNSTVSQSDVIGFVADVESRDRSKLIVQIEVEDASHVPEGQIPSRIRVSAFTKQKLLIGDEVAFSARLTPLPRPVSPGAFDYGRMLYFQSVGAMGSVKGEVTLLSDDNVPWRFQLRRQFHALRSAMGARITAAIPGPLGAFANAVITGERAAIPAGMNKSLQISGLYHILSISGLHMSMVAGGVFWFVRALLALSPKMALHYPIKKWAAAAALIVGLIYMLLADFGAATERSYIMIAVMFFAVLVDRPAVSLRNLAIAAILILVVTPEESVGASFQMSFLAVMALTAFFEWWKARAVDEKKDQPSVLIRYSKNAFQLAVASILTTLVAGGASSVAAMYHFGRVSPYGVVANGITLPIVSTIVMPPALAAAMLMPFGLETYPLKLMEFGLWLTMQTSDWVASWPYANLIRPQPQLEGIVLLALGLYVFCVGIGRFRFAGVALMMLGFYGSMQGQAPDILVEDRAANVALRNVQGELLFADAAKGKFAAEKWLQANGENLLLEQAAARPGWTCDGDGCYSDLAPLSIGYLRGSLDAWGQCPPFDIIVADFPLRGACKDNKVAVDRFDVWRNGAYAITFRTGELVITSARQEQGARPWVYAPQKAIKIQPSAQ